MQGINRLMRDQPHRAPAATSALGRVLVRTVFLLRFLPARHAHCALCALRFAWEVNARYHCSCRACEKQNERGQWVLQRNGLPGPITVPAVRGVCPSL